MKSAFQDRDMVDTYHSYKRNWIVLVLVELEKGD
jgi:hypothetical protein